jgi:hypothetical protein
MFPGSLLADLAVHYSDLALSQYPHISLLCTQPDAVCQPVEVTGTKIFSDKEEGTENK